MKVRNYDFVDVGRNRKPNNRVFPNNIRCIMCGPAGCGKTNLLMNFLCDWLDYDRLHVYSKTLQQEKYKTLRKAFEEVCPGVATFSTNAEDVPPPNEHDGDGTTVLVLDDVMLDKQDVVERYFAYGRHVNVDIFYLVQTYSRIPKRVIRDNANLLILFRQDDKNLKHVYDNHVGVDMMFEEFKRLGSRSWNSCQYGFLTIDKTVPVNEGRYKNKFG